MIAGSGIAYNYFFREEQPAKKRLTQTVIGQFLPCLVAGIFITTAILQTDKDLIKLLPGIWAILYAMGNFSSRIFLPKHIGWVALYYLIAGALLLNLAMVEEVTEPSPWWMVITFGIGQILTGIILYWNLERKRSCLKKL
jgi:purine-cytosine permease-like protein